MSWSAAVEIDVAHWDNPELAVLDLQVHPAHRTDDTVAEELLRQALDAVRASGRTNVLGEAWQQSWLAGFWERQGWPVASRAAQRRIVLAGLDRARLDAQLAAAEQASAAYDIEVLDWPTPEPLMEGLLDLHRAMNDAPLDDLEIADDVWTVPRLVASEASLTAREARVHRLVARRRSDGVLGGYTVFVVHVDRPDASATRTTPASSASTAGTDSGCGSRPRCCSGWRRWSRSWRRSTPGTPSRTRT